MKIKSRGYEKLIDTLTSKGLKINTNKTRTWYGNIGNDIPECKTFKYLGVKLRHNGENIAKDGSESKLRNYTNTLRWIAKKNTAKAYKLFNSYVSWYLRYQALGGNHENTILLKSRLIK